MNRLERFAKELRSEGALARKMLERVPADKFTWQPHAKSMSVQSLSTHIAELPGWISMVLHTKYLDFAAQPYTLPEIKETKGLVDMLDASLEDGLKALSDAQDSELDENWTLRNGDQIFASTSKDEWVRSSISQIIHHRAQLGVFLRLLDVPIPGTYGPSADDPGM